MRELDGAVRLGGVDAAGNQALIAANVGDHGLERDDGGLVEEVLGRGGELLARLAKDAPVAAREHEREVADDVALALVRLGHGEDLGLLGLKDLGVGVGGVPVVERLALPEGIEDIAVVGLVLVGDLEGILRPRGELVELVEDPVRAHLGGKNAGARLGAAVAHEQVEVIEDDLVALEQVAKRLGATNDGRLALGLLVALHVETGALDGYLALLREEAVFDGLRALGEHGVLLGLRGELGLRGRPWVGTSAEWRPRSFAPFPGSLRIWVGFLFYKYSFLFSII